MLRAYTGKKALERALSTQPDLVILDANLPDLDGFEVCRALRGDPRFSATIPILMTTSGHPTRTERLSALRAGAWDFLGHPIDAEELLLRLDAYVLAKFEADRVRDESLLDQVTGLYNLKGLGRRARELGSQAFRHESALACVVVAPDLGSADVGAEENDRAVSSAVGRLAGMLKKEGRASDVIARVGRTEFAVIAFGTDAEGAVKLAQRLARSLETEAANGGTAPAIRVRAGYEAVANFRDAPIEPLDLVAHATTALRRARADSEWILPFEQRAGRS